MKQFALLVFLIIGNCLLAQNTIFVDQNQLGGQHDGSSWANAFIDLQQALALADDSDAIWVAAGIYYPTNDNDKTVSFVLKQGVALYGGFSGFEISLMQRDWANNLSILSGDIGIVGDPADNSFHVLYGSGIDSTTILDGFMVTMGRATGAADPYSNNYGGGLLLEPSPAQYNTNPIIQHCCFVENFALEGAGIHAASESFGSLVSPLIRYCEFQNNLALNYGGGIHLQGKKGINKSFLVEHCGFYDNSAKVKGGGAVSLTQFSDTVIFRNCVFERDSSVFAAGGALFCSGLGDPLLGGTVIIDSCNFVENFSPLGSALTYLEATAGKSLFFNLEVKDSQFEASLVINSNNNNVVIFVGRPSSLKSTYCTINNTLFNNNRPYGCIRLIVDTIYFQVRNCQFINNRDPDNLPDLEGYNLYAKGKYIRGDIENCLFAENSNGILFSTTETGNCLTRITNSTFFSNNQRIVDKTWYPLYDSLSDFRNDCYLSNCVFREYPDDGRLFTNWNTQDLSMHGFYIDYSLVNRLKDTTIAGAAAAYGDHMIFNPLDPMFEDTLGGDFRLMPCSPAVNSGTNETTQNAGLLTDLDGNPRIFKDTVDMGAYETQDSCFVSGASHLASVVRAKLMPNPIAAAGVFTIELQDGGYEKMSWKILNAAGQMVSQGIKVENHSTLLSFQAPENSGIYFVHIKTKDTAYWGKLLVQN